MPNGVVNNPLVFVSIDRGGIVTIVAHRSEMATGSRTSIPMIVADEMEADWSRVRLVQAEGDEKKYGTPATAGSRSLRHHIHPATDTAAAVPRILAQPPPPRSPPEPNNPHPAAPAAAHTPLVPPPAP